MIPERVLQIAIAVVALIVIALIITMLVRRFRDRDRAPAYEDERTMTDITAWAQEARAEHQSGQLYDSRTLAEMAARCPVCDGDHPGTCKMQTWVETRNGDRCITCGQYIEWEPDGNEWTGFCGCEPDDDVITGTIIPVADMPGTSFDDDRVSGIMLTLHEIETQWHNLGGGWDPPSERVASLPAGDWLRELLVGA